MMSVPQDEHRWLQQLVGEWTYETEASMGPDKPAEKFAGTESVRSLGGLWVLAEGQGEMPGGGAATMLMTLGFDPRKGRYVGTWVGSMMTHLWVYDGEMDADGKVLTLTAEGPGMDPEGKMANYRDVIEVVSDDERTMSAFIQGDDGEWRQFMTTRYRRAE